MILNNEKDVDLFVASRIGSLKHIKCFVDSSKNNKKYTENLVDIKSLQKDDGITCMEWESAEETNILIARKNRQIQVFNTKTSSIVKNYGLDCGEGQVVGLAKAGMVRMAAVASGLVRLWTKKTESLIETGGKLDIMKLCGEDQNVFVTGGEENDVKLWRIGEPAPFFVAKNLPADWLQLRRPVWVTGACFVQGSEGKLVGACSRLGYVRLYDSRAQRRPVTSIDCQGMSAVCIAPGLSEDQLMVGFARGHLKAVELRMSRLGRGYTGAVGAVTSVACHNSGLIFSASLDRHVRVHEHATKQLVYKQYVTSKVSAMLLQTATTTALRCPPQMDPTGGVRVDEGELEGALKAEEELGGADDMDSLFENMQTIHTPSRVKKRQQIDPDACGKETKIPKSSETSSISLEDEGAKETAIAALLRSTERQKRRAEKRKRQKKAKSVFS